jgi:nucleotide-binding universal stress UspA family protein
LVTLRFGANVPELSSLILALSIKQIQNAGSAAAIISTLQTDRIRSRVEGVFLRLQKLPVVRESLQHIRDLSERLQDDLLVIGGRTFEGRERRATLRLSHAAVENGLCKPRRNAPR